MWNYNPRKLAWFQDYKDTDSFISFQILFQDPLLSFTKHSMVGGLHLSQTFMPDLQTTEKPQAQQIHMEQVSMKTISKISSTDLIVQLSLKFHKI